MVGSTLIILMSPPGNEVEVVCRLEDLVSALAVEKRLLLLEEAFFSKGFVVVVNAEQVWEKRMHKMDNFMLPTDFQFKCL